MLLCGFSCLAQSSRVTGNATTKFKATLSTVSCMPSVLIQSKHYRWLWGASGWNSITSSGSTMQSSIFWVSLGMSSNEFALAQGA